VWWQFLNQHPTKEKHMAAKISRITTVVGEDKAPITTLALGEEHVITTLVGEQAHPHPDYEDVFKGTGSATTIVGEQFHPITTTVGEDGPEAQAAGSRVTTTLLGEEGGGISTELRGEETIFTTTVVGEEGHATTTLLGEGGGGRPTTTVYGEEGNPTTTIVGEGGPFGGY
jgi:hypothetical protein